LRAPPRRLGEADGWEFRVTRWVLLSTMARSDRLTRPQGALIGLGGLAWAAAWYRFSHTNSPYATDRARKPFMIFVGLTLTVLGVTVALGISK